MPTIIWLVSVNWALVFLIELLFLPLKEDSGKRKNRKTCYKMSLVTWSELWIKRKSERALSMAKIKSEVWIRIAIPTEWPFIFFLHEIGISAFHWMFLYWPFPLFFIYLFYISIFDYSFTIILILYIKVIIRQIYIYIYCKMMENEIHIKRYIKK